jgi:branched-chain amino acid transport system permease protein
MVVCAVLGILTEKIAYKPLRKASPLTVLITAIGVSYFLESLALLIFGSKQRKVASVITMKPLSIGSFELTGESIVTLGVTIIIMIALTLFINKTKTGKAMLAVSEDKGAAQLMGVNVDFTISVTFAIGSALAAVAGTLFTSSYGFVGPYTGAMPGIKAFVAAVLGGIGSIPGAMLGGIILGIIESFSKAYISTQLADAIVFGVLIVVLLVRPTGLLGKKRMEKV